VTYQRYRTRPPWRRAVTFGALLLAAVAAATAARADEAGNAHGPYSPARIAEGVTIGETQVGGMTAEQAATAVTADFRRPIPVVLPGRTSYVAPDRAGGVPLVEPAVRAALTADPDERIGLHILVDRPRLARASTRLAAQLTQPAVDAKVELHGLRPVVSRERYGLEVQPKPLARAVGGALAGGSRSPLEVRHTTLVPRVLAKDLRTVIVIRRSANELVYYQRHRKQKKFGVATGQTSYPTPLGAFTIVDKQLNPWWYPPSSDWAAGASPIPPGPGNPLGTRWMGLSVPAVGIHGTPDAASIGYSASHGCIRMRIPDAEWLFDHVSIGTPVFIVE
jgi:lipoprotein-anchoring transpeptidase ErfK/SrfK